MIIQFHTPKGIVEIDSEKVTDAELAKINMDRQKLNDFLVRQPKELATKIDEIKTRLEQAEIKINKHDGLQ